MENKFKVVSKYKPTGDQPQAIEKIAEGFQKGLKFQTLLGVTGSGKTFTMANIIEKIQKPTLVIAHNKTLAAQLYNELKEFFPENAVEYFVSYYDYYQPEAYVPSTDTYIEKDSSVNDEIDKLRHSATAALVEREDVIVVASVSCIYGLGDPEEYYGMMLSLRPGMEKDRDEVLRALVEMQYDRNDLNFERGTFRVRGDVVEIFPIGSSEHAIRVEFFGDEIDRITGNRCADRRNHRDKKPYLDFPRVALCHRARKMQLAIQRIEKELEERLAELKREDKLLEAQRLEQRTNYDLEMLREMGFCTGIENYSRHLSLREAGSTPFTLIDFFPEDFLIIADESHVSIPQIRAMYEGDRSRKQLWWTLASACPQHWITVRSNLRNLKAKSIKCYSFPQPPLFMKRSILSRQRSRLFVRQACWTPKFPFVPFMGRLMICLPRSEEPQRQAIRFL